MAQINYFPHKATSNFLNDNNEKPIPHRTPREQYAYTFPKITELNTQQQAALNDARPFYLTGVAGCGKSTVALWRHIINIKTGKQSIIFVYNVMLRHFLKACVAPAVTKNQDFDNQTYKIENTILSVYRELHNFDNRKYHNSNDYSKHFIFQGKKYDITKIDIFRDMPNYTITNIKQGSGWDDYFFSSYVKKHGQMLDEIIVDEAQDLESIPLEMMIFNSKKVSICADFNQQMYNNRVENEQTIRSILDRYNKEEARYELKRIFRYSREIYEFVIALTGKGQDYEAFETCRKSGVLPIVHENLPDPKHPEEYDNFENIPEITNVENVEINKIVELIETYKDTNIAILLPHAVINNDKDRYHNSVEYYFRELSIKRNIKCSFYINSDELEKTGLKQDPNYNIGKVHISTFKSVKGLEFDTVIIPKIQLITEREKKNANTMTEYYVSATRSIQNLILLSNISLDEIPRFQDIDESCYDRYDYQSVPESQKTYKNYDEI